ncbi:MAG: relaxase/mobilization nuclease domain-containing protein [Psychrobacillus sp.]
MPVFEVLGGTRNVKNTLNYCENETVTTNKGQKVNKCALKAGVNCDITDIHSDFEETRTYFNKSGGRQGMHFALSFDPKELPNTLRNQQKCLEMGIELAGKIAKDYESGVFVHVDQDHLHCHIVTNSVAFQTGKKYHMEKNKDLVILRNLSDQICKEHGIEPLETYKGSNRAEKSVEKRIKERGGVTWKSEIVEAVNAAKKIALSPDHYKELLFEKGVDMYKRGEQSFGYEHIGQREAGNTKFRMRDSNKALEDNHYDDVLQQIQNNQNHQLEPEKTVEQVKRAPKSSSTISLPPVSDDFEETIAQSQAEKADIRANTSRQLEEADTEEKRAEIKEKEAFKLQQAEIEKEIRLKDAEFYSFFQKMLEKLPYTTFPDIEEVGRNTSFYFGGFTKKRFKVTLERENECISLSKKENNHYEEQDLAFLQDRKDVTRLEERIANQAALQEQQAHLFFRRSGPEL